ncbi:MAG: arginine--tRNA ligase [Actinobacteria bacterium]|nr:arginine--tRNA ligase [Actinomycetota bacterium]
MSEPVEQLAAALAEIAGVPLALERPSDATHGDYATNVAMRLAGGRKQPPRAIADELAGRFAEVEGIDRVEVAGPGFVNLFVSDEWLASALGSALGAGEGFGGGSAATPERIQVEMVSANPTGPLTIGSARNGAYGDAVARLLAFAGHQVEREYYYNDAGSQMERFRASVDARRRGEALPEDGYQGAYIDDLAKLDGDPVPRMIDAIGRSLEQFRIGFDSWERQSVVEADVDAALAQLETFEQDGAVWARTSAHGDDQDRVVVRSNGEPTYFAADAAYIRRKYARGFERLIYVLGADHHGYVGRLQALAEMYGRPRDSVEVLLYQLVHLTRAGEKVRMGKRSGNVVFLDDLIDEVGVDAARWYLVNRGPDREIEIDVDLAAEKSVKNPVFYVQYTAARVSGVFREAGDAEVGATIAVPLTVEERAVVKRLLEFPSVARLAAERRAPQLVTDYAIRLADDYHRFYHDASKHKIVGSKQQTFRLGLSRVTRTTVARCLDLVGVEAPERM